MPSEVRIGSQAIADYLQIDFLRLLSLLRASTKWIVLVCLLGAVLGASYAHFAKPRFTVTTDLILNPADLRIVSDNPAGSYEQRDTALLNVESKRQTLVSRSVLRRAIVQLDLQDDPEFVPPKPRFSLRRLLGGGRGMERSPDVQALETLRRQITARRDENSFVVTLSVWTSRPEKSVRISEAIIDAFRQELIATDSSGAKRSVDALQARIGKLKDDVNAADEAVETFRRDHGLQSSQGELVSTRSMSQIHQQLVQARLNLISAKSRYRELSSAHAADAAATQSNTVATLRTQYAEVKARIAAQSLKYGARYPGVVQLEASLRALGSEIDAETQRVVLAAKNDLDQAQSVVAALNAEAVSVGTEVFADNNAQIKLRELSREADAKAAIYKSFLLRAHEFTERQKLDTTNIQVISPPIMPKARSWPPSTVETGGFGAVVGMVLGILAVLALGIAADLGLRGSRPRHGALRRTL